MNHRLLLIAAALAGVSFTTTVFAYSQKEAAGSAPTPRIIPSSVVNPTKLPLRYADATVNVAFSLDQSGQPRNIEVLQVEDVRLKKQLVEAFSQWRFDLTAISKDAAAKRFVLPIHLLPES